MAEAFVPLPHGISADAPEAMDLAVREAEEAEQFGPPPPGHRYDLSLPRSANGSPAVVRDTRPVDERGRPQPGGHPPHVPTKQMRKAVSGYRLAGTSVDKIAALLEVSPDTLRRYYADELAIPPTLVGLAVQGAKKLLTGFTHEMEQQKVTDAGQIVDYTTREYHPPSAPMIKFVLSAMTDLKEKTGVELTGKDGGAIDLNLTVESMLQKIERIKSQRTALPAKSQDAPHDAEREPDSHSGDGPGGGSGPGTAEPLH